jgi:hypothetical protein
MGKLPKVIAMLGFLGVIGVPAAVEAQTPQTRDGFWFNVGLGYGSLGCQDCDSRLGGVSGSLALGGTLSDRVLLGAGSNSWYKEDADGATLTASTLSATVRFYPSRTGGFFLLGGLGVGVIEISDPVLETETETGGSAILGLGYDFRVARNVSLTPYWNGVGISSANADANFGQIGLGLTVH